MVKEKFRLRPRDKETTGEVKKREKYEKLMRAKNVLGRKKDAAEIKTSSPRLERKAEWGGSGWLAKCIRGEKRKVENVLQATTRAMKVEVGVSEKRD